MANPWRDTDDWTPIKALTPTWGCTYRGHYLDVAEYAGRWYWSVTHPRGCAATRGIAGGPEPGRQQAMHTALAAADRLRCLAPRRRNQ